MNLGGINMKNILSVEKIEKYYGNSFDGAYYLQKFFDYQLELPEINIENYINYHIKLIPRDSSYYIDDAIRDVLEYKKFNLRDCNKYFELLRLKYQDIKNSTTSMHCFFFIGILFPILLAVKIKDINQYNKIKAGNGKEDFFNLMMNCKSLQELFKELTHLKKIDKTIIDELYQYIFISKEDDG